MPTWTQTARANWRPLISFFEKQTSILRELEAADQLRRFRVAPSRVNVDVTDPTLALTFTPEWLTAYALKPDANLDLLAGAVGRVLEELQPGTIQRLTLTFQSLTPIATSYDEARSQAGDRVMPMESVGNVDFAIIGDLADEKLKASIRYEAGIVEAAEASNRLALGLGQEDTDRRVAGTLFPVKSMPDVALYNRQEWRIAEAGIEAPSALFDLLSRTREQAEVVDAAIYSRLMGTQR